MVQFKQMPFKQQLGSNNSRIPNLILIEHISTSYRAQSYILHPNEHDTKAVTMTPHKCSGSEYCFPDDRGLKSSKFIWHDHISIDFKNESD